VPKLVSLLASFLVEAVVLFLDRLFACLPTIVHSSAYSRSQFGLVFESFLFFLAQQRSSFPYLLNLLLFFRFHQLPIVIPLQAFLFL